MTEQYGFASAPDPEANRAEWLAQHPGAGQVTPEQAQAAVDPGTQEGVPSSVPTPGDMVNAGAHAGLPFEDEMNALMEQVKAQQGQIALLLERDRQREQAAIAAFGEPILQRYANAVRDHLKTVRDTHPQAQGHFDAVIADAEKLATASADAISRGANDLGQVAALASRIDRFIERGHRRTAPHLARQVDLSTVGHHLEYLIEEAARLAPGALAIAGV